MGTYRRVNVASGRQLEKLAHYSRALRVGDTVLQSGTTAIDRQGNVRGEGDVGRAGRRDHADRRVEHGQGGRPARRRRAQPHLRHRHRAWPTRRRARSPATSATRGRRPRWCRSTAWPGPTQLVEIELDAVDGAASIGAAHLLGSAHWRRCTPTRGPSAWATASSSRASTALSARGVVEGAGDMYRQTRATMDTIFSRARARPAACPATSSTPRRSSPISARPPTTRGRSLEALGDVRPDSTLLGIPALVRPEMLVEIEAEAVHRGRRARGATSTPSTCGRSRAATRARSRSATTST